MSESRLETEIGIYSNLLKETFNGDEYFTVLSIGEPHVQKISILVDQFPHANIYAVNCKSDDVRSVKGVTLVDKVVSHVNGKIKFFQKDNQSLSSIYNRGSQFIGKDIIIDSITLNSLCKELGIGGVDVLIVYSGGMSYDILSSANSELNSIKIIDVQTEDFPFYEGEHLHKEVMELLSGSFNTVNTRKAWSKDSASQYNMLLVNKISPKRQPQLTVSDVNIEYIRSVFKNEGKPVWIGTASPYPKSKEDVENFFLVNKKLLMYKQFYENVNKPSHILDVGCGCGFTTKSLFETFKCNVSGIDYNSSLIKFAKINNGDPLISYMNIDFLEYESDRRYDCIFAVDVYENLPEDMKKKFVDKALSLLTPTGRLFISMEFDKTLSGSFGVNIETGEMKCFKELYGCNSISMSDILSRHCIKLVLKS